MDKKERKTGSRHKSLNDQRNMKKRNIHTKEKRGRRYEEREEK